MIITDRKQFERCLRQEDDGQFVAKYKGMTIRSVFQPIYSKALKVIGVEALARISDLNGKAVRPDLFFHSEATNPIDKINVERLSRTIHIRNFSVSRFRDHLLFLNVLPNTGELLNINKIHSNLLLKRINELNLRSEQLVMELLELDANCEFLLQDATISLNEHGFLVAIDDYGVQASTKERTERIRPNIIKIDRTLLLDYEKGQTEKLLNALELANKVQSKTVIEGIETEHQLKLMQNLNVDMYQGYLLAMPEPVVSEQTISEPA